MVITRRGIIGTLLAAPVIIRTPWLLMPVKTLRFDVQGANFPDIEGTIYRGPLGNGQMCVVQGRLWRQSLTNGYWYVYQPNSFEMSKTQPV